MSDPKNPVQLGEEMEEEDLSNAAGAGMNVGPGLSEEEKAANREALFRELRKQMPAFLASRAAEVQQARAARTIIVPGTITADGVVLSGASAVAFQFKSGTADITPTPFDEIRSYGPVIRALDFRKDRFERTMLKSQDPAYIKAACGQMVGEEADAPCTKCAKGDGPFKECVVVDGYFLGCCCNCYYSHQTQKGPRGCSFRAQD